MNVLINILLYQAIWFICVIGENRYLWAPAFLLGIHFYLTPCRKADLIMVCKLLMIGIIVDGSLNGFSFYSFPAKGLIIPYWLIFVWMALATLPNHSLKWMSTRPLLSILFGTIGGPAAYWAGVRLGAAHFNAPLIPSLLLLGLIWGTLWPIVMYISKKSMQPATSE